MRNSGKQVLVTGGSGFIGQHLVAALIARDCQVRILDVRPPRSFHSSVQYISGSANDPAAAQVALNGVDEVYHLAAIPSMWRADKGDFVAANVKCTEVMLTAARRGITRFLHCSTESVLFNTDASNDMINEKSQNSIYDMPGYYTRSKKAAEDLALAAAAEGRNVVIANPTMPIGSHPYELTPPTAMIAYFTSCRIQFYVDAMFNLVDARDVASGLILVMERGRVGERYILGGENISLGQLLDLIAALADARRVSFRIPTGAALTIARITELLADHVFRHVPAATREGVRIALRAKPLSSEKARNELGYTSRSLGEALSETLHWLKVRHSDAVLNARV
jgi:dihydroflavonol-4-reductase